MVKKINSRNAEFQKFQVLKTNRNKRHKYGEFFVEGVRNINGAVEGGWKITSFLYTRESVYESALRLYELEDSLAGLDFLRVSRSAIVNFRCIQSIRPELGGRLLLTLENREQVYVSRQYAASIKEKLRELERSFGR